MQSLWDRLTAPSRSLPAELHLQARLLSATLLLAAVGGAIGTTVLLTDSGSPDNNLMGVPSLWFAGTALCVMLYISSRLPYYTMTAWVFVASGVAIPLAVALSASNSNPSWVLFTASLSVVGIASAALLLWRGAVLTSGVSAVGLCIVLPSLNPAIEASHAGWTAGALVILTALMVALAHQRKLAEDALREFRRVGQAEEGARHEVMQAALDAVIVMDAHGDVLAWNPSASALFGWTAREAVGRKLSELIIPTRFRQAHKLGLARFLKTGRGRRTGRRVELPALHASGSTFPVEVAVSPVRTPQGAMTFWAFIRDLTEQRQVEEQLAAARDEALEASRLKSDFLANMSHEIRTPMNGVIGMTGLLLDTELSREQAEYADTVRACGDSLLAVINDILDFSKVEAGHLELEVVEFDVRNTIEEAVELLASKAQDRGLDLICALAPDVHPAVAGDPGRLRQVVINLVDNAIKFTASGDVLVRVTTRNDEQPAPPSNGAADAGPAASRGAYHQGQVQLRVEVHDTGIGVDDSQAERLFLPFTQADGSTTRRFGGTGLGLSICKQIVELMGGQIGARSASDGAGSVFWFQLPLARLPVRMDSARDALAAVGGGPRHRALIVIANAKGRDALMVDVGSFGVTVDGVGTLEAAMELLPQKDYGVILADAILPDGDAHTLMQWIEERDDVWAPLVVLVDRTRSGQARRLRRDGARYLTKPVRRSRLADRLRSALKRQRTGTRRVATRSEPPAVTDAKSPRVLVAEDNSTNARLTAHMLEHLGYRAHVVANGLEALDALRRLSFHAVIMDCQMPEMDGFDATLRIRETERVSGESAVPIIALTADAQIRTRDRCLASGMNDYLTKPLSYDGLKSLLDAYAPARRAGAKQPLENNAQVSDTPLVAIESNFVLNDAAIAAIDELQQPGTPDLLSELMELYLGHSSEGLAAIEAGFACDDVDVIAFRSHELKSSSASLGALRMADLFGRMETAARTGTLDEGRLWLGQARRELPRVQGAMRTIMADRATS